MIGYLIGRTAQYFTVAKAFGIINYNDNKTLSLLELFDTIMILKKTETEEYVWTQKERA